MAAIENLLDVVMVVIPGRPIADQEVADRWCTLVDPEMRPGQIPRRVRREEAHERIEVPIAVHRLIEGARQLDRVRDRGLLRHHPTSIPPVGTGRDRPCPSLPRDRVSGR